MPTPAARLHPVCLALALACTLVAASCSHPRPPAVRIPPSVDLHEWPRIGLVRVQVSGPGSGRLEPTTTFMQAIQSAQGGVALLELGDERALLAAVGHSELDFNAARAIGERYGVDAVFVSRVELSEARPKLQLSTQLNALRADATVQAAFHTRLLETRSGATLWTGSANAERSIARVSASKGGPVDLRAADPDDAYGELVRCLVRDATHDLRPRWERP